MLEHDKTVEAYDPEALNEGNLGKRLADPETEAKVDAIVARMSLEQKLALMHGVSMHPVEDLYLTPGEPSLGIVPFKMVDGPRGVRAGIATTFPVAMARGATWDLELEQRVGEAIAKEARARGANVLLAPAINLLRHPGWGRAQETYGEDSLHVGRMGVAFITGVQRHLVASVKHFALNSIENSRFDVDVLADARTLHEVYLPHFEAAVREAHVGSVMSAYNKVNGAYCAENAALLRDILKGEWGFLGFVESDWLFGTRSTVASALAGLDIEMPHAHFYGAKLAEAVRAGKVGEHVIDEAARRIVRVQVAFGLAEARPYHAEVVECHEHVELALEVAHKSHVLLKNEGPLLPLDRNKLARIAVVGTLSGVENTGDRGSSAVQSSYVITPVEGIRDHAPRAEVLHIERDVLDPSDREHIRRAEVTVVVVGLTWKDEGENIPLLEGGGDRTSLRLPARQEALIREVSALTRRVVVVLVTGSAIEVRPWVDEVPALLCAFYSGMLGGEALADVLFGEVCPSGKLPISFARRAEDLPGFDPSAKSVRYEREHGYTHLARQRREPELPFGFGLSYTRFEYQSLRIEPSEQGVGCVVTVEVANVGERAGDEVVQLYASLPTGRVSRPESWLVGFARLSLRPGATGRVVFRVGARELAYYDVDRRAFAVEPGEYVLEAGSSSRERPLRAAFHVPARL